MEQEKINENIEKLATHLERANLGEYFLLLGRPWRMFWLNFITGLFRGFGMALGMTVIFAIVIYLSLRVLRNFMDVPIIGTYIAQLVEFVNASIKTGVRP